MVAENREHDAYLWTSLRHPRTSLPPPPPTHTLLTGIIKCVWKWIGIGVNATLITEWLWPASRARSHLLLIRQPFKLSKALVDLYAELFSSWHFLNSWRFRETAVWLSASWVSVHQETLDVCDFLRQRSWVSRLVFIFEFMDETKVRPPATLFDTDLKRTLGRINRRSLIPQHMSIVSKFPSEVVLVNNFKLCSRCGLWRWLARQNYEKKSKWY